VAMSAWAVTRAACWLACALATTAAGKEREAWLPGGLSGGVMAGRTMATPPLYAGRQLWDDTMELRLREFFASLGGPRWKRKDGWERVGEEPAPPPPPPFDTALDVLNTSTTLTTPSTID
jgi:hypothetical protein